MYLKSRVENCCVFLHWAARQCERSAKGCLTSPDTLSPHVGRKEPRLSTACDRKFQLECKVYVALLTQDTEKPNKLTNSIQILVPPSNMNRFHMDNGFVHLAALYMLQLRCIPSLSIRNSHVRNRTKVVKYI